MPGENSPVTIGRLMEWRTIGAMTIIATAAVLTTRSDVRSLNERLDRLEEDVRGFRALSAVIHEIDKRTAVMEERDRKAGAR